jgi:xanthine/uracil permease
MGLESQIGLQACYGALLVSGALGILIAPLIGLFRNRLIERP